MTEATRAGRPVEWASWVGAGLLSILLIGALWLRTDPLLPGHPAFALPADHHMYAFMATHPLGELHVAPWGWRLLAPLLVDMSGLAAGTGFRVLAFGALATTTALMFPLARLFGATRTIALLAPVLFASIGFATKFTLFDFWLTDPLAFAFVAGAAVCAASGRDWAFATCLTIGVVAKESVLLVALLYYGIHARKALDPAAGVRTLLLSFPAVAVLLGIRVVIPAWNGRTTYLSSLPLPIRRNARTVPEYGPFQLLLATLEARDWPRTVLEVVSGFGLTVTALAALGVGAARTTALRLAPYVAAVIGQVLFAQNTERLVVLAFPAVVVLAVEGLRWLRDRAGADETILVALVLGAFGLQLVDPSEWEPHAALPLGLLLVLTTLAIILRRKRIARSSPQSGAIHRS
jgi:hypothetical protein